MADFDAMRPPVTITNPAGVKDPNYPRHLHKGKDATYEYIVVKNDAERDEKVAEGWHLTAAEAAVAHTPKHATEDAPVAKRGRPKHATEDAA